MPRPRPRARPAAGDHAARPLSPESTIPTASKRVADAFRRHFPADGCSETGPAPASEDFGSFGAEWHAPSVFWFVGGTDPDLYAKAKEAGRLNEIPANHSPRFAPVIHPTLRRASRPCRRRAAWLAA